MKQQDRRWEHWDVNGGWIKSAYKKKELWSESSWSEVEKDPGLAGASPAHRCQSYLPSGSTESSWSTVRGSAGASPAPLVGGPDRIAGDRKADFGSSHSRSQSWSSHGTNESWSCCGSVTCKGAAECQKALAAPVQDSSADDFAPWTTSKEEMYMVNDADAPQGWRKPVWKPLELLDEIYAMDWRMSDDVMREHLDVNGLAKLMPTIFAAFGSFQAQKVRVKVNFTAFKSLITDRMHSKIGSVQGGKLRSGTERHTAYLCLDQILQQILLHVPQRISQGIRDSLRNPGFPWKS